MRNLYFSTTNHKRTFYDIKGEKALINVVLNKEEILDVLIELNKKDITALKITDTYAFVYLNDIKLVISEEFLDLSDEYDIYLAPLITKLKVYAENEALKKYKGEPKVKRNAKLNPKKMIIAGSLATSLFLTGLGINKKVKKEEMEEVKLPPISDVTLGEDSDNSKEEVVILDNNPNMNNGENIVNQDNIEHLPNNDLVYEEQNNIPNIDGLVSKEEENVNNLVFDFEFRDSSQNGKLATTKEYLGKYVEHYAKRWGLPVELMLAQISQERPNVKDGKINNPCQITYKYFVGQKFKVPVYDENGFTNTYDEFVMTEEALNTYEGNVMAGLAYVRECIDNSKGLLTGIFLYNQGEPSLRQACKYYNVDINNYKGDDKSLEACELIRKYNQEVHGKGYGDPNYLTNVFQYLILEDRGSITMGYYSGSEKIEITINNLNRENNMVRG